MRDKIDLETRSLDLAAHELACGADTKEILDGYARGFYSLREVADRLEFLKIETRKIAEKQVVKEQERTLDLSACDCGCSDVEVINCWLDDPCHECAGCAERRACEAEDRFEEGA